ncbi:MAG: 3-methyl-2-oxobutanoate hydroxymethyltransferase [Chromatiales bacterium]
MITINTLNELKQRGEKIAVLTSYDASFTMLAEQAGVEVLLVGDSLSMVVQGHDSTLPVSMDDMVYHTANVSRANHQLFVVADMPFMSYATPEQALQNAGRLMKQGGAHMVKLEGGHNQLETVERLTQHAVPVCAHLGLLPQSVRQLGGYSVQGREPQQADQIRQDAQDLQSAGAQMLVLECVPAGLATDISRQLRIPVIGIGAGPGTDGQVLVVYDMLGISCGDQPRFVKNFLQPAGSVLNAMSDYVNAVKDGSFPGVEHSY